MGRNFTIFGISCPNGIVRNEDIIDVSRDFLYAVEISTFLKVVLGKILSYVQSAPTV